MVTRVAHIVRREQREKEERERRQRDIMRGESPAPRWRATGLLGPPEGRNTPARHRRLTRQWRAAETPNEKRRATLI